MTSSARAPRRVLARLFRPVDAASLAAFRVAFGAIGVVEGLRYLASDAIRRYYVEPEFHFTYYGFSWVQPWPGIGMHVHIAALVVLSALVLAGLWYRVAALLLFLGFTYVFLLDQAQYLNHYYLVSLVTLLFVFVPAHRTASLDARRRPRVASEHAPAWSLWLLRAQIGIVYFYAGIAKLNADWLRGEPVRAWLDERGDMVLLGIPIGGAIANEWATWIVAYGGLLLDLLVVPLLLWRPTRAYAFAAAIAFHLGNAVLFSIGIFPWFMIAATTLFLEPDWPRRVLGWPRRREAPGGGGAPLAPRSAAGRRAVAAGVWAWLLVQLLFPLRHFLYPGTVHWTEEGHRFSWHMKLRSKEAHAYFRVRDPETREEVTIDPRELLTERQLRKMPARPDMILQFAHHLADRMQRPGGPRPEVRVLGVASLNGRRYQHLVDPEVDLAAQPRNLRHAEWIVPLAEPLRPPASAP